MRLPQITFIVNFGFFAAMVQAQPTPVPAQGPAAPGPATATASTTAPGGTSVAPAVSASTVLQPALSQTQATLSELKIDKWKKGSVRDEAGGNVHSLLHDLETNLPPLLTAADAEPGSLSRAIPLMKHLDAFYDVLLRVEEASRVSAPSDQVNALQQTLLGVNQARIAFDDQLQTQAASQEKQVFELRTQLKTQKDTTAALQAKADAAAVSSVPCKPAATTAHKRKKSTTTPASKPSGTAPATQKPSAGTPAAPTPQKPQ